jgi:hypothetical protein
MTIRAKFDGRVLVPEEPIHLPIGSILELHYESVEPSTEECEHPLAELADFVKDFPPDPSAPVDGAAQHDHYLYGSPKRP